MREPLTYAEYDKVKHQRGHTWFYFPDQDFYIMAPPKCASSSIKQFIWMHELEDTVVRLEQCQTPNEKVYVVVRDPLSRFCSLWKSKCCDTMTPVELMDHIENGAKNAHWTPQVDLIGDLDPVLIPLELFSWWWKQSGLGKLGRFNTTDGDVDIDDELKKRILTFYADDVLLHNKAECDFCWETTRVLCR